MAHPTSNSWDYKNGPIKQSGVMIKRSDVINTGITTNGDIVRAVNDS
jgi:hypothetical protein